MNTPKSSQPHGGLAGYGGHMAPTTTGNTYQNSSEDEDMFSEGNCAVTGSNEGHTHVGGSTRKRRRGVIEKRRRDRINNSLNDLKRLVPQALEKSGSAKLEKAEILQMTVEHLKHVSANNPAAASPAFDAHRVAADYHGLGFRECAAEISRYLIGVEGMDPQDPLRVRLVSHLQMYVAQKEFRSHYTAAAPTAAAATAAINSAAAPPVAQQFNYQQPSWYGHSYSVPTPPSFETVKSSPTPTSQTSVGSSTSPAVTSQDAMAQHQMVDPITGYYRHALTSTPTTQDVSSHYMTDSATSYASSFSSSFNSSYSSNVASPESNGNQSRTAEDSTGHKQPYRPWGAPEMAC